MKKCEHRRWVEKQNNKRSSVAWLNDLVKFVDRASLPYNAWPCRRELKEKDMLNHILRF